MSDTRSEVSEDNLDSPDFVTPELPGHEVGAPAKHHLAHQNSILDPIPEEGIVEPLIIKSEAPRTTVEIPRMMDAVSRYSRSSSRFSRGMSVCGELESLSDVDSECCITGWDCIYTNDDMLFWSPKDITEEDADLYRKVLLRDVLHKKENLIHEIQHVCRMNFPKRMEIICEALQEKGIKLGSDSVQGEMTESPLHVALIYEATDVAFILMKYGKADLIMRKYECNDCYGTTALHKAITKGNLSALEEMMAYLDPEQKNALLHQQASGEYFRGKFSQTGLPLSLAALVGNKAIFDALVRHGAQVDASENSTGNNIIHSLVRFARYQPALSKEMIEHIFRSPLVQKWWLKRRGLSGLRMTCTEYRYMKMDLLKKSNFEGYTPLTLSAAYGITSMCDFLMKIDDVYRFPQWRIGPTAVNYYDITEIDSSMTNYRKPSVLDLFLYSSDTDRLDFCNMSILKEVMHKKWDSYKWYFLFWFVFHLAVMILLTFTCEQRIREYAFNATGFLNSQPTVTKAMAMNDSPSERRSLFWPEELAILVVACFYILMDVAYSYQLISSFYSRWVHLVKHKKLAAFKNFLRRSAIWELDIYRLILLSFSFSCLASVILRVMDNSNEAIATAASLVFGWTFMLGFTRALRNIGIFTVMLQRMMFSDLLHFLFVFSLIVLSFTSAFRILFFPMHTYHDTPDVLADLPNTFFSFFRLTIGLEELDIFQEAAHPTLVKVLFGSFVLLANILLVNMLIAAMSDTYSEVTHQKENLWLKIRTKSICLIEQHLPSCLRSNYGIVHRQREDHQAQMADLWLLPVEEYVGSKGDPRILDD